MKPTGFLAEPSLNIPATSGTKLRALKWAGQFPFVALLDSCATKIDQYGQYEWILAVGKAGCHQIQSFDDLSKSSQWRFGYFSYDLKNQFEPTLSSRLPHTIPAGDCHFFEPHIVICQEKGTETIQAWGIEEAEWETKVDAGGDCAIEGFSHFASNFSKEAYIETVEALRAHIRQGDCYEINLCQEFSAAVKLVDPVCIYEGLTEISPVPFAAFLKMDTRYVVCASPERFLKLKEGELITQPIKGTRPRGHTPEQDEQLATELRNSIKEQAENVMIVDLSRNDLYRSSEVNSVSVPHLFEVQSFPQVHHLVSTITSRLRAGVSPEMAIRNAFPPGSMTGAPKVRVCELIEEYERSARGIYAGSIGYFTPNGDFDLNVVIRSLIYDAVAQRISYHVGGAITYDSNAEAEYEETRVKARAIEALFANL